MKKLLLLLLLIPSLGRSLNPRPRFELIYQQSSNPLGHSIEVLHDRETGEEVVCIYGGLNVPSCYLTGRKW